MDTYGLTPRSAEPVVSVAFSGDFGQPDGFGSVLVATIRRSGALCLMLTYRPELSGSAQERVWSVELTSEQRKALVHALTLHEPLLWKEVTTHG